MPCARPAGRRPAPRRAPLRARRGLPAGRRARIVIYRRSQQRVAELDRTVADRDDAGLLGRRQACGVSADGPDGVVDRRHRGLVAGRGDEQRPSRLRREREDAALVQAAHLRGSRQGADDRLAP